MCIRGCIFEIRLEKVQFKQGSAFLTGPFLLRECLRRFRQSE